MSCDYRPQLVTASCDYRPHPELTCDCVIEHSKFLFVSHTSTPSSLGVSILPSGGVVLFTVSWILSWPLMRSSSVKTVFSCRSMHSIWSSCCFCDITLSSRCLTLSVGHGGGGRVQRKNEAGQQEGREEQSS